KGLPRTKVKLVLQREGVKDPIEVELERARIELETVFGVKRKADDSWDFYLDPENKIGYLRLTAFQRSSYRDLKRAMDRLTLSTAGLKGFILDLRFNPGGLLDSAVKISDLFIDDGQIVTIRPRASRAHTYTGEQEGSLLDFPMVCLINSGSA